MRTLAVVVWVLMLVAPAMAQPRARPVDEAGPLGIPFSARDLKLVEEGVGFDADQRGAARALFDGYRASFMDQTRATNAAVEAEDKADGGTHPREKAAEVVKYVETVRGLERRLLDDLKELCTPAQAERFPGVERALRRRVGFRLALAAGEGVDLIEILKELKVDAGGVAAGAPEVVSQWELDVDRLMVEKDQFLRTKFGDMIASDGEDGEKAMKARQGFIADLMRISGRVRDVNRRAARELEPLLPEESRAAFRHAVEVRTFPRIYGPSRATKVMDECLRLGDLSAEQKAGLEGLKASYAREVGPVNARLAAAAVEMQEKMAEDIDALMMGGEEGKEAFWGVQKEKHALDERTIAKAQGLVSAEQWGRVKQPERDFLPEFLPDVSEMERGMTEEFGEDEEAAPSQPPPPPPPARP
jgi:hypothetical protein